MVSGNAWPSTRARQHPEGQLTNLVQKTVRGKVVGPPPKAMAGIMSHRKAHGYYIPSGSALTSNDESMNVNTACV